MNQKPNFPPQGFPQAPYTRPGMPLYYYVQTNQLSTPRFNPPYLLPPGQTPWSPQVYPLARPVHSRFAVPVPGYPMQHSRPEQQQAPHFPFLPDRFNSWAYPPEMRGQWVNVQQSDQPFVTRAHPDQMSYPFPNVKRQGTTDMAALVAWPDSRPYSKSKAECSFLNKLDNFMFHNDYQGIARLVLSNSEIFPSWLGEGKEFLFYCRVFYAYSEVSNHLIKINFSEDTLELPELCYSPFLKEDLSKFLKKARTTKILYLIKNMTHISRRRKAHLESTGLKRMRAIFNCIKHIKESKDGIADLYSDGLDKIKLCNSTHGKLLYDLYLFYFSVGSLKKCAWLHSLPTADKSYILSTHKEVIGLIHRCIKKKSDGYNFEPFENVDNYTQYLRTRFRLIECVLNDYFKATRQVRNLLAALFVDLIKEVASEKEATERRKKIPPFEKIRNLKYRDTLEKLLKTHRLMVAEKLIPENCLTQEIKEVCEK